MLKVGDRVYSKHYGKGKVTFILSKDYTYNVGVRFTTGTQIYTPYGYHDINNNDTSRNFIKVPPINTRFNQLKDTYV